MNLRLDRMSKIQILKCPARPIGECSEYEDKIDIADYSSKMFNMFSGRVDRVTLNCELDMREPILDRFGARIPLTADCFLSGDFKYHTALQSYENSLSLIDINHFETQINAAVSDGFVSWLMQFGNKIKVVEPQYLADMVKEKAQAIFNIYE